MKSWSIFFPVKVTQYIVVVFNYGTTLKGGCDDVKTAGERLVKVLKKNNMYERRVRDPENPSRYSVRKGYWFHVDGALCASYMLFLEMAYKNGLTYIKPASVFDFRLDFIPSIVTSGHKFIGTPWPSGIYLTRNSALCPTKTSISVIYQLIRHYCIPLPQWPLCLSLVVVH